MEMKKRNQDKTFYFMIVILSIPKGPQQAGKGALVNEAYPHSRLGHSDKKIANLKKNP